MIATLSRAESVGRAGTFGGRRGYFGIGVVHAKHEVNVGTLLRSAAGFGAAFVFTVGRRYKTQAADTGKAHRHMPLYHYETVADLIDGLPVGCPLVGVEIDPRAVSLATFRHPERACYLLGAEDHGLTRAAADRCHYLVQIPGSARCLNVAAAGTVVLYDRVAKAGVT